MENILISLIGAAFGSILSLLLPNVVDAISIRKQRIKEGSWKSKYLFEDTAEWIDETVEINYKGSNIIIVSNHNPKGDNYKATLKLVNNELVGRWESLSGHSTGNAIFAVGSHGRLMYGYFSGEKNTRARIFSPWLLGLDENDIKEGEKLLHANTLPVNNDRYHGVA